MDIYECSTPCYKQIDERQTIIFTKTNDTELSYYLIDGVLKPYNKGALALIGDCYVGLLTKHQEDSEEYKMYSNMISRYNKLKVLK